MSTFRWLAVAVVGLPLVLLAPVASAGDKPRAELTPYIGYRMGGQFDVDDTEATGNKSVDLQDSGDWGVDLGIYRDPTSFYELVYSHASEGLDTSDPSLKGVDVTIEYLQVGGTLLFTESEHYVPYLSLTVGATKFDAGGGYGSETKFSGSLGGGVRFPFAEHFAATLGVRGYLTAVSSDTEFFCTGSGSVNCLFKTTGSTFFQGEALIGFTATF